MPDENLLLYLNLTGELFYIIGHRMKSQEVKGDLEARVFNDLGFAICNPEVIRQFMAGKLRISHYKFHQMRSLLDHIVHSSIMSMNDYSLEKLFELTLIATKYQFTVCKHPRDILLIALNHLDSIRKCVTDPRAIQSAEDLHHILVDSYAQQSTDRMQHYLQEIRNYVHDVNLKMTNLINLKLQRPDGTFVVEDDLADHCNGIQHGNLCNSNQSASDEIGDEMPWFRGKSCLELDGNRVIRLGLSLYDEEKYLALSVDSTDPNKAEEGEVVETENFEPEEILNALLQIGETSQELLQTRKPAAVKGLDLCSTLLGCNISSSSRSRPMMAEFSMSGISSDEVGQSSLEDLIPTKIENAKSKTSISYGDINVVRIDGRYNRNQSKAALSAMVKDLDALELESRVDNLRSPLDVDSARIEIGDIIE